MQFYDFCQHFIIFCLYFRFSSGKRQKLYNNLLGGNRDDAFAKGEITDQEDTRVMESSFITTGA